MSVCQTKRVLQPLVCKRTISLETVRNHPGAVGSIQVITVDPASGIPDSESVYHRNAKAMQHSP